MIDYTGIGKQIKDTRISKKLTQEKLAELTDISTTHLSNIERGFTKLGLYTLVKLSDVLEVSADYLLCHSTGTDIANSIKKNSIIDMVADCSNEELILIEALISATKQSFKRIEAIRKND